MSAELELPNDAAELFLSRGDEVNPDRPLLQGDVLEGVEIPGLDDEPGLGIIVTHACSMRHGVSLAPRLRVARVSRCKPIESDDWIHRYARHMPLPWLEPDREDRHFSSTLEDAAPVRREEIERHNRIACLTPYGLALLQQRIIFSSSRHIVPTSDLHLVNAPVLAEVEMLEDWREAARAAGSDYAAADMEFEIVLSEVMGDKTLRDHLKEPTRRAGVRRRVAEERRAKYGARE